MDCLDWEVFEDVMKNSGFRVADHGPLFGPVTGFKLKRGKNLQLVLETVSAGNERGKAPEHIAGAVYLSEEVVSFEGFGKIKATAKGVIRGGSKTRYSEDRIKTIECSSIHSIEIDFGNEASGCYLMEWIENLSDEFQWPLLDRIEVTEQLNRAIDGPLGKLEINSSKKSSHTGCSCAQFVVDGVEIIVGKSRAARKNISSPGYILYKGTPSEDFRNKIRGCLSFSLGCYLVFLGETIFDEKWGLVACNARRSVMSPGEFKKLNGFKPTPLDFTCQHMVSNKILGELVGALYAIYDEYELRSVLWGYWNAINAPIHMKAAHLGAALEGLQKSFAKKNPEKIDGKIISDTKLWKLLRASICKEIEAASIADGQKEIFVRKINNINQKPQGALFDDFFANLGLNIGQLEKDAWNHRNHAAHGGGVDESNVVQVIRETKVIQVMFNRALLALAGVSSHYVDFYSLHWPIVELRKEITDDRSTT